MRALATTLAMAQTNLSTYVPEKRVLISRDVDFVGEDLTAIFDTSFAACQNACLADDNCQAFTFNSRSNACFPFGLS